MDTINHKKVEELTSRADPAKALHAVILGLFATVGVLFFGREKAFFQPFFRKCA